MLLTSSELRQHQDAVSGRQNKLVCAVSAEFNQLFVLSRNTHLALQASAPPSLCIPLLHLKENNDGLSSLCLPYHNISGALRSSHLAALITIQSGPSYGEQGENLNRVCVCVVGGMGWGATKALFCLPVMFQKALCGVGPDVSGSRLRRLSWLRS